NRIVGVALGLVLLDRIGPFIVTIEPDAARAVADFHTVLNLAMAVSFLPLLRPFARLLVWLLPARVAPADPSQPIYLNEAARETPAIALAGAAREVCAWPMCSKPCSAGRSMRSIVATATRLSRPRASTTCSIASIG